MGRRTVSLVSPFVRGYNVPTMAARTRFIRIRVDQAEQQRLEAAAKRCGLGVGPWLRSLGLTEASRIAPATATPRLLAENKKGRHDHARRPRRHSTVSGV